MTAQVDVRDGEALAASLDAGVQELGRLDIVVANAGIAASAIPSHQITESQWEQMLAINLTGVWKTCRAAVPHLVEGGHGGSMILTSSMAALRVYQGIAAYSAAKHGVVGLMKTMARARPVFDPRQLGAPHSGRYADDHEQRDVQDLPPRPRESDQGRLRGASASLHTLPVAVADPLDISKAVVFLASDDARLITGVTLPIDAGLLLK